VVAMPSVASAVDCDYQHIKVDYTRATFIDPPIAPWDVCLHVGKVVGTLNGTYTVCWSLADRIPSTDVYGDTFAQIFAVRYFSRMETKDGIVDFIEWGWYDGDFGLESGFAKVVAGTGPFEDAFGTLSWPPRFPNLGGVVIYEGYICTP
jgi:hypothetical protein